MSSKRDTPPTGIDVADIDRHWRAHWADRIPSSIRIGARWGDDVERVPVLPLGKRYPSVDGELDQLIETVLTVVGAALGPPPVILVTHGWQTDADGRPTRDVFLADHSPDARFWRTDDLAVEPGFSSLVHSYFQVFASPEQARPVIDIHACDSTDDVFFADVEMRTLIVLRNGWVEIVAGSDGRSHFVGQVEVTGDDRGHADGAVIRSVRGAACRRGSAGKEWRP